MEAAGAVDAQNAPTAPRKTLRVFHELPQGLDAEYAFLETDYDTDTDAVARSDLFERQRRLMDDWAAYLDQERPR